MNEVLQQLYDRKSVRVFEEKEISAEDKEAILRAAVMAQTAGNGTTHLGPVTVNQELRGQEISCWR